MCEGGKGVRDTVMVSRREGSAVGIINVMRVQGQGQRFIRGNFTRAVFNAQSV